MNNIILLLFMFTLTSLIFTKKMLLMCLMSMEAMMLSLILFITLSMITSQLSSINYFVIILTLSVSEASLGLGCLVASLRSQGNDSLKTISMIKC